MNLWLALIWLIFILSCIGLCVFLRKHLADIGQDVAKEVNRRISGMLETERDSEQRLIDAFLDFESEGNAVAEYQKKQEEIITAP